MLQSTPNQPTVNKLLTKRNRTFTLIEMLVVVVIIGILAGVLVPRLVGAKERANDSARIVKVGQISSAVELYAQDSDGTYPKAPLTGVPGISVATPIVTNAIAPYLSTIPTDPGKGTVAIDGVPGNIQVTGDSFAYWTDIGGKVYAVTALMESKKGNTTNAVGVVDSDKQGSYQVVGKGLIINILPSTPGVHYVGNDIVVTDGTNTYVIADKNVGATQVGTDGTNAAIRGSYFQWGNNYGFSTVGTLSPSSTIAVNTSGMTTYTGNTWIYGYALPRYDWSATTNNNLRQTGGPCPSGYHIPTYQEWRGLVNTRASLTGKTTSTGDGYAWFNDDLFSTDLKLPKAGNRLYGSAESVRNQGGDGYYWSSTPLDATAYGLSFVSFNVNAKLLNSRAFGFSVRCFENSH